jgi:hypothetical protein
MMTGEGADHDEYRRRDAIHQENTEASEAAYKEAQKNPLVLTAIFGANHEICWTAAAAGFDGGHDLQAKATAEQAGGDLGSV